MMGERGRFVFLNPNLRNKLHPLISRNTFFTALRPIARMVDPAERRFWRGDAEVVDAEHAGVDLVA